MLQQLAIKLSFSDHRFRAYVYTKGPMCAPEGGVALLAPAGGISQFFRLGNKMPSTAAEHPAIYTYNVIEYISTQHSWCWTISMGSQASVYKRLHQSVRAGLTIDRLIAYWGSFNHLKQLGTFCVSSGCRCKILGNEVSLSAKCLIRYQI